MTIIELKGRVSERGQLEFETPPDLPPSEVKITIEIAETVEPQPIWTEEELAELLRPTQPMTGEQLVHMLEQMGTTGWENEPDGATWIEEHRRKRRGKSQW